VKYKTIVSLIIGSLICPQPGYSAVPTQNKRLDIYKNNIASPLRTSSSPLIFDIPVTYNKAVSKWISYYQNAGRPMFMRWIERSSKYFPMIQSELSQAGLPKDLAYMVMIESGFIANAESHADAVGPWQFIESTGQRYGLRVSWWLDERRDLRKSTQAAIQYIRELFSEFESWYLVAASYNMGENGLRKIIQKHKSKDYWYLIKQGALPQETQEYVPKFLAAMLIAKAPSLYGMRGLNNLEPFRYQLITVPGGTQIDQIADYIGVTRQALRDLNSELKLGMIPKEIPGHTIRVPVGAYKLTKKFVDEISKNVAMD
jgi:membrane-bound lytic murein transglycosylase D